MEFVNLNRYEETVRNCLSYPVRTGKVLLYGSSFFRVWGYERSLEQLLEATGGKLETVNHGFGGATVDELLYHNYKFRCFYKYFRNHLNYLCFYIFCEIIIYKQPG